MKNFYTTDTDDDDDIQMDDKLMDDAVAHCVPDLEPGEYLDPTSGYKLEDCRAWVREEEEKMRQEREAIDAAEEEARIRAAEHHDDDAPHESWCDLTPDDDLPF